MLVDHLTGSSPTVSMFNLVHPCDRIDNGGCRQKCIKKGQEHTCLCNVGFKLAIDGKSCDIGLF